MIYMCYVVEARPIGVDVRPNTWAGGRDVGMVMNKEQGPYFVGVKGPDVRTGQDGRGIGG
jgi:hypothetical protein